MKEGFFSVDGKFYTFMSKVVDLGFISLLWLVGCLPVVTIITSTASAYQTVVKCVRYEQDTVFASFKEAYLQNLRQGIALTLFFGILGGLISLADYYVMFVSTGTSVVSLALAMGMLILTLVYLLNLLWIGPVFSRFANTFGNLLKLNYVVALRHVPRSVPMLLLVAAGIVVFLAWNELFIIVPGVVLLCYSLLAEPALRKFMPEQEEDNGDWRYGFH